MSTSKKDAPGDGKRPHATLDLKATEVAPAEQPPATDAKSTAAADGKGATGSASSAAGSSSTSVPASRAASAGKPVGDKATTGEKPASDKPSATTAAGGAGGGQKNVTPPPAVKPAGSGGRLISHLLAGIAGGVLAIALADWIAPQLGISTPTQVIQARSIELQDRVARLERESPIEQLTAKLKDAEARVAALEGKSETLAGEQQKSATETKAAVEKLAADRLDNAVQQRLSTMDERLATIAKAAEEGPKTNSAGQMAAVTGKLADLQGVLGAKIDEVRGTVPQNLEARLTKLDEQTEAGKTNTVRVDSDINNLRTDAARLGQRFETLKADSDRAGATIVVLKEETARLTSEFAEMKATVASQVKGGVGEAITPVTTKLSTLEQSLQSVLKSEGDRRINAERIVVSLELGNLKRLIDSGQKYADGLAAVRKVAGDKIDLKALEMFQDTGVPTIAELQRSFRPVANAAIDAAVPAGDGVFDKLVAGAKSVVRVRNLNPAPEDKSVDAVISRMQVALSDGILGEVLARAGDLPEASALPLRDWLANVKARHSVDRAIDDIETQMKTSLTQAAATPVRAATPDPVKAPEPPTPTAGATKAPDAAPTFTYEGRLPAPGSTRFSEPSHESAPTGQP